ncbi:MAG: methyltransferase domain-containing protein [Candidatus Paceibacterota bacterium]
MKKNTKLDKNYQKKYFENRKRSYSGDTRAPAIKRLSKKYLGEKVLDVGAGSGALINIIPNAVGIDITPKNSKVQKGDITNLQFRDNYFNTVFALEVLEHLDKKTLDKGLKEIRRVLKEEGCFIVTTPYNENLEEGMVMCPKCELWFHKDGHVRSFNKESMKKIIVDNGFEIISFKVLPLGSLGRHLILGYFWRLFNLFGLGFKPTSIFLVAQKKQ